MGRRTTICFRKKSPNGSAQQGLLVFQVIIKSLLSHLDYGRNLLGNESRVGQRCEAHEPDPVGVRIQVRRPDFLGQTALACATAAREGDKRNLGEEAVDLSDLILPADEALPKTPMPSFYQRGLVTRGTIVVLVNGGQ